MMTHRDMIRKPLNEITEDPKEKRQSPYKIPAIPTLNLKKIISTGRDPKSPILAEVSEHKQKLRQAQNKDKPIATTFDPLGRMKEVEENSTIGEDLYYVETVDDEDSEEDVET